MSTHHDPLFITECKMMDLPKDEIGFYINVTKVGEYLIYTCDDAYDLVDDNTVYCVFNGTQAIWDGLRHSCRKREYGTISNGPIYIKKKYFKNLYSISPPK